ncbi:MAG: hypothetical protein AMS27_04240 [Bacteroides sp. SM23_62_1]|nr:MAG: hypothetical protein AMS27_04240 [Bacteroides sp. SM23_62_1]
MNNPYRKILRFLRSYFITGTCLSILFVLQLQYLVAQDEECAFTLREAEQLYNQGLIENIPQMLQSCIEKGFTKEDRLSAYKLITLCSLYNDDQDLAHEQMLAFLKKYPEYELTPTDPEEFRFLFEEYKTRPIFDYGVFVGVNYTHGITGEPFSPLNQRGDRLRYRPDNMGLQVGGVLNFYITKSLQVAVEPMYTQKLFRLDHADDIVDLYIKPERFERQSYVDVPLTFTYDFDLGRFRPYVRAGGQFSYLFEAKTSLVTTFVNSTGELIKENSGPDLDMLNYEGQAYRKLYNYSAVVGGGVKLKITKGYFYLDTRYNIGLNLQNTGNRFELYEQIFYYMNTDSDFRLNNFMVTFGFVRSFYKPRQIIK